MTKAAKKTTARTAKPKTRVSFKTWATTIARARGKASAEINKLRDAFPAYKNDNLYATKFPLAFANYQNYCTRGSQSLAA